MNGLLPSADGYVYLADSIENAVKFLSLECSDIMVFSVHIKKSDEKIIDETFDHSIEFFKCKAYGYRGTISPDKLGRMFHWKSGD